MNTTTETQFVTLREALGTTNALKRIVTRRIGTKHARPLQKPASGNMVVKLLDRHGELMDGRWCASADTCKQLGYATILVTIEEAE